MAFGGEERDDEQHYSDDQEDIDATSSGLNIRHKIPFRLEGSDEHDDENHYEYHQKNSEHQRLS